MKNKEIKKFEQELCELREIQKKEGPEKLEPIKDLAKRIGAPLTSKGQQSQKQYIDAVVGSIHMVLQTEIMFNACVSAKWSCMWAAIAAIIALAATIAAWITVLLMLKGV